MTAVVPELDGLALLDFDPQLPCETTHDGQPPPAAWRMTGALPCHHTADRLLCDGCAEAVRVFWRQVGATGWRCNQCGWAAPRGSSPFEYLRIEPLP